MKRILLGMALVAISQIALSQDESWVPLEEKGGLTFYYSLLECDSNSYIALKIENQSGINPAFELYDLIISEDGSDYVHTINYRDLEVGSRSWEGSCLQEELIFSISDNSNVEVRIKLPHEN